MLYKSQQPACHKIYHSILSFPKAVIKRCDRCSSVSFPSDTLSRLHSRECFQKTSTCDDIEDEPTNQVWSAEKKGSWDTHFHEHQFAIDQGNQQPVPCSKPLLALKDQRHITGRHLQSLYQVVLPDYICEWLTFEASQARFSHPLNVEIGHGTLGRK